MQKQADCSAGPDDLRLGIPDDLMDLLPIDLLPYIAEHVLGRLHCVWFRLRT